MKILRVKNKEIIDQISWSIKKIFHKTKSLIDIIIQGIKESLEKNKNAREIISLASSKSFTALTENQLKGIADKKFPSYEMDNKEILEIYTSLIVNNFISSEIKITTNDMYDTVVSYLHKV